MWLDSLIHVCGEIKIRRLQNENPGSSPARPWYYAGNINPFPDLDIPHQKKRKKKTCSIPTGVVPLWLKLDVLVVGMKQSLSVDIRGRLPPTPPPPHRPTPPCPLLLPPSFSFPQQGEVNLYFSNLLLLLRNRFSWSVGAGSLSLRYHPAGTAQPSSQMAVFFSGIKHMN